jgi:hypothetical protein
VATTKRDAEKALAKERDKLTAQRMMRDAKADELAGLRKTASASMAGVDDGDLDQEALRQAQAGVDVRAAEIALAELDRRVADQQRVVDQAAAEVLRADRAELAAAGAALVHDLRDAVEELLPGFERLAELNAQHMNLDARLNRIEGYPGGQVTYGAADWLNLGRIMKSFLESERVAVKRRAELVNEGSEANRRIAAAEARVRGQRVDTAPPPAVVVADQSFAV